MSKQGTFAWNELMTPNVEAAKAFYAAVLGWTYTDMPMPDGVYTLAHAAGVEQPVAGLFPWPAENPGSRDWFAYIAVDDINEAVAKTAAAGGQVVRGPWPIPGVGQIAIIMDAAQSAIGYMQPEPM